MKTALYQFNENTLITHPSSQPVDKDKVKLVICFAGKAILAEENIYLFIKVHFPNAAIAMCSTAGEIYQDIVQDESLVLVAMEFEKTAVRTASVSVEDFSNSYAAAEALVNKLQAKDLAYIMVFSDGGMVNGSELVKGLSQAAGDHVLVTGGLAGDGSKFNSTLVGINEQPSEGKIVAAGFYGKNILVTHGSQGGWDMFGLEKIITRSCENVLYEIDDQNALDLYKKYLGPDAANLPVSALLFPLSVTIPGSATPVVRTILSIDEDKKSMTFAGDVPVGSEVRFMRANFDRLTAAAATAAQHTIVKNNGKPDFAMLVSCVGRKIILGQRVDDEVEAVSAAFENKTLMAGFYSYGEISPFNEGSNCQLHNQTMTITSFYELP